MSSIEEATARVAEFVRQARKLSTLDSGGKFYSVWTDPNAEQANLTLDDLAALTAAAPHIQAAALREFAETVRDFPGEDTLRNHIAALAITRADQLEGKTE